MANEILHNHYSTVVILLLATLLTYTLTSGQSSPCNGSLCLLGNCTTNGSNEMCTCSSAYPNCIVQVPANCSNATNYCLNNSTCEVDGSGDIKCLCSSGFMGDRCEKGVCADDSYCNNQGVCTIDTLNSNNKSCKCNDCYNTGPTCDVLVDLCAVVPLDCHPSYTASCYTDCINGEPVRVCNCRDEYVGDQCENDRQECASADRCNFNGNCTNLQPGYRCDCESGWEGTDCKTDINECTSTPSLCNTTYAIGCTDVDGSYYCNCILGYTGQHCDMATCEKEELCSGQGNCSASGTVWSCACNRFYSGRQCEIAGPCVRPCDNPCVHGSCDEIMVNGTVEHICTCEPGWTNSSTCNDNINECDTMSPCMNGGTCIDTEGSYSCNCTQYWTGDVCNVDVLECENSPCGPGSCIEEDGGYSCNCSGTGFEGPLCEVDLDECKNSPCMNEGTCDNSPGSYSCTCNDGWEGRHCETRNWCADGCTTANIVSCINLVDKANCTCAQGFLGHNCAIMDPCHSDPCHNSGACVSAPLEQLNTTDSSSLYSCQCTAGYTGQDCESALADPNLAVYISVPIVLVFALAIIIGLIVCFVMARKKRATRGRYSPSRNEILGPNLQMSGMLKPPPEERLI